MLMVVRILMEKDILTSRAMDPLKSEVLQAVTIGVGSSEFVTKVT